MIKIKRFSIEEIIPLIGFDTPKIIVDNFLVKTSSNRLICFATKGIKCVECGLEGSFFVAEKSHLRDINPHLNLYAIRKDIEVLMTADHIIPKSKSNSNLLFNLQTMCCVCNCRKGDTNKNVPVNKGIWNLDIDKIYEVICKKTLDR